MKTFILTLLFSCVASASQSQITGCWKGRGVEYGSLGSYVASCSVDYKAEAGVSTFTVKTLAFDCGSYDHWIGPEMIFNISDGKADAGWGIEGSITEDRLVFDFPEVGHTNHADIKRANDRIEIVFKTRFQRTIKASIPICKN